MTDLDPKHLEREHKMWKTLDQTEAFPHLNLTVRCEARLSFHKVFLLVETFNSSSKEYSVNTTAYIYNVEMHKLDRVEDPPTEVR